MYELSVEQWDYMLDRFNTSEFVTFSLESLVSVGVSRRASFLRYNKPHREVILIVGNKYKRYYVKEDVTLGSFNKQLNKWIKTLQ